MATREVIIVGGGLAGLSAAIYLGRSRRDVLLIHSGRSMAVWEPDVQNYLGFPDGISGRELVQRGERQMNRFGAETREDEIRSLTHEDGRFSLRGERGTYTAERVLLATGLTHVPPDIPGVRDCLGRSLFFCKDCDAYRVQGKRIVVIGRNDEAADYALAMLLYSPSVAVATNGTQPTWSSRHGRWLAEYRVPVRDERIVRLDHRRGALRALIFQDGEPVTADAAFTTRGDVYHSDLARNAGAELDGDGEIAVDARLRTSVPGLYAAGCVTPANCQMIVAAGQGAIAAQAINRDLFEESLRTHRLRRYGSSAATEPGSVAAGRSHTRKGDCGRRLVYAEDAT